MLTKVRKTRERFIVFPVAQVPQNKPEWGGNSKPETTVKSHTSRLSISIWIHARCNQVPHRHRHRHSRHLVDTSEPDQSMQLKNASFSRPPSLSTSVHWCYFSSVEITSTQSHLVTKGWDVLSHFEHHGSKLHLNTLQPSPNWLCSLATIQ